MPDIADLLTTAQAAQRLGMSDGQVRKLAASGKLVPARRYAGALLLFRPEDLARYDAGLQPGRGRPRRGNITESAGEFQASPVDIGNS